MSARNRAGRGLAQPLGSKRARGFTLIEILVVLAIIAILAALLFPAFKRAQESAKQTNCTANLQQIYTAVRLYYDDEKKYPASLAVLLPSTEKLDNSAPVAGATPSGTPSGTPQPGGTPATSINGQACDTATNTCPNAKGTGFLKSSSLLVCPDDDTDAAGKPRSSYGSVATIVSGSPGPNTSAPVPDLGRYVWNYYGYKNDGFAYTSDDDAYKGTPGDATTFAGDASKRYLRDPSKPYNTTAATTDPAFNPVDLMKLPRLANRQAPSETIITHCVNHRLPTSNLADPYAVNTDTANASGAIDTILRLDGTVDRVDISNWKGEKWIKQLR